MGQQLTPRMADVLTEAAGRRGGRVYNDGRPNYLRALAGMVKRGAVTETAAGDYLTPAGRAAVAGRIDAAKLAGQAEAAEVAELAHRGELARRHGWKPNGGNRVQVIGGPAGKVTYGGHNREDWQCRTCGRGCRVVDVTTDTGSTHYGYSQCELAPTTDTLADYLTRRADVLAEGIDLDPTHPAADRWRVELATWRRVAAEVTEAEPVAELAGPEAAELAERCDRAAADYMTATPGAGLAGVRLRHLAAALRSVRRGGHPGTHLLALAAAERQAERAANLRAWCGHDTEPAAAELTEAEAEAEDLFGGVLAAEDGERQAAELAAALADQVRAERGAGHATLDALAKLADRHPVALAALAELAESGQVPCWWVLRCDRPADHLAAHPVLRWVTACERCRPVALG